jgi:hypothetical protein
MSGRVSIFFMRCNRYDINSASYRKGHQKLEDSHNHLPPNHLSLCWSTSNLPESESRTVNPYHQQPKVLTSSRKVPRYSLRRSPKTRFKKTSLAVIRIKLAQCRSTPTGKLLTRHVEKPQHSIQNFSYSLSIRCFRYGIKSP